jgi:hypothetical protein
VPARALYAFSGVRDFSTTTGAFSRTHNDDCG